MKNLILFTCTILFGNFSFSQCEDFDVTINVMGPTCYGHTDAAISLIMEGGEAPYISEITDVDGNILNVAGGGVANTLGAGWYYIYVVDESGCVFEDSVQIVDIGEMSVDLTIVDPSYPGACDGMVTADTVYNYQGDYESIGYGWCELGGGVGVNEITDVCAGGYCLSINDENGCSIVVDFVLGSLAGLTDAEETVVSVTFDQSSEYLTVTSDELNNKELTLSNLSGQVVFSNVISEEKQIFRPLLGAGMYIYTIQSKGEILQTGKVVFN